MKHFFLTFTFFFITIFSANAQTKTHTVQPKETIYGISKQYNVSIADIESANIETLKLGIKPGQILSIPEPKTTIPEVKTQIPVVTTENGVTKTTHQVQPQETLFSIARLYNVSVLDIDNLNAELLSSGLRIGQIISIPNKKKTLDGRARIINAETIFHIVEAKETKYSISKKYGVSIEKLESQNPEIVSGLIEGNRLAINTKDIKPTTDNEELMIALAEKQVALEKSKTKAAEIEDLNNKLNAQKEVNQKVLKVNDLKVDLKNIDSKKGGSVEKLKLVLEANKNVQDILLSKLDSLVLNMEVELDDIKKKDITNLEESKVLEEESYKSISKTDGLLNQLKQDLASNRKNYALIMNKVQKITYDEHNEYKKKVRDNTINPRTEKLKKQEETLVEIKKLQVNQEKNEIKNQKLITKIDSIGTEKKVAIKRHISKATFYGAASRNYDDKYALEKINSYKNKIGKQDSQTEKTALPDEIANASVDELLKDDKSLKLEVLNNLTDVKDGFYVVLDIFNDPKPRDVLILKMIDSGQTNTSFFYNVNVLSYYVYSKVFDNAKEAIFEYKQKHSKSNYEKMFIVQIQNK